MNTLPDTRGLLSKVDALEKENVSLKAQVKWFQKQIFGSKSEKLKEIPENQEQLFKNKPLEENEKVAKESITYSRKKPKKKPKRQALPEHLERRETLVEPDNKELICSCGCNKKLIRYETTEELEYEPAKCYVNQIKRGIYACESCPEKGMYIPYLPLRPIEKGIPGPGLLEYVATSKYIDHLPLYRQQKILGRQGVHIPISTMSDWVGKTFEILMPLYELIHEKVLYSEIINADETTIKVKTTGKEKGVRQGYYYGYIGDKKYLYFKFEESRNKDGPNKFLREFNGDYIQVDGYGGYNEMFRNLNVPRVGCMAHVRRKFKEAYDNEAIKAMEPLKIIKELYAVECDIKDNDFSATEVVSIRQEKSRKQLNKLESWCKTYLNGSNQNPSLKVAATYCLNCFSTLEHYLEDARLEIDNNIIERAIRPIALGRKNYLFAGSVEGAKRAALLYSLVGTCALHNVEPSKYLKYVISNIKSWPYKYLENLLPGNLKIPDI